MPAIIKKDTSLTSKRKSIKPKQWLFLDKGLDDFRRGAPSNSKKLTDEKPKSNVFHLAAPVILNDEANQQQFETQRKTYLGISEKPSNKFAILSKNKAVLSKQLPRSESRKNEIKKIESKLLAHPIALYPHLIESLPAELVHDVSRLLETDMPGLGNDWQNLDENLKPEYLKQNKQIQPPEVVKEECEDDDEFEMTIPVLDVPIVNQIQNEENVDLPVLDLNLSRGTDNDSVKLLANIPEFSKGKTFRWLIRDEDKKKPAKTLKEIEEEESAKKLDKVTTEFAEWSNALSESTANVEPSTIKSLFASGYETKPALTVPIQVYELSSLPTELRLTDIDNETLNSESKDRSTIKTSASQKSEDVISETSKPIINEQKIQQNVKIDSQDSQIKSESKKKKEVYGKWYVKPTLWNLHYTTPEAHNKESLLNGKDHIQESSTNIVKPLPVEAEVSDVNLAAIQQVRRNKEKQEMLAKETTEETAPTVSVEVELAGLHSAKAFREYLESNPHVHRPQFMNEICKIQDQEPNIVA